MILSIHVIVCRSFDVYVFVFVCICCVCLCVFVGLLLYLATIELIGVVLLFSWENEWVNLDIVCIYTCIRQKRSFLFVYVCMENIRKTRAHICFTIHALYSLTLIFVLVFTVYAIIV